MTPNLVPEEPHGEPSDKDLGFSDGSNDPEEAKRGFADWRLNIVLMLLPLGLYLLLSPLGVFIASFGPLLIGVLALRETLREPTWRRQSAAMSAMAGVGIAGLYRSVQNVMALHH